MSCDITEPRRILPQFLITAVSEVPQLGHSIWGLQVDALLMALQHWNFKMKNNCRLSWYQNLDHCSRDVGYVLWVPALVNCMNDSVSTLLLHSGFFREVLDALIPPPPISKHQASEPTKHFFFLLNIILLKISAQPVFCFPPRFFDWFNTSVMSVVLGWAA